MILTVAGVVTTAVAVAALGWWLSIEGPSPGLGAATVGAPLAATSMGFGLSLVRLREAMTNKTGERQVAALAEAWELQQSVLIMGLLGVGFALALLVASAVRARGAKVPVSHWSAAIPWSLVALGLGRLSLSWLRVLRGWAGADTMVDPDVAIEVFVLMALGFLQLPVHGLLALISLLVGVGLRWRRG